MISDEKCFELLQSKPLEKHIVVLKLNYYLRNGEPKLCLQQSQNNKIRECTHQELYSLRKLYMP